MATAAPIRTSVGRFRNPYNPLKVGRVVMTVGAEAAHAADEIRVSCQFKDARGNDCAERCALQWYLSNDANGDSICTTAPTTASAAGTDGLVVPESGGKYGFAVCEADGDLDFDVTDSGTPTFYLVFVLPDGSLDVSGAITFA